jgi:hypothetical protein
MWVKRPGGGVRSAVHDVLLRQEIPFGFAQGKVSPFRSE